ncbi:hypothetical protein TNCV_4591481 [Trichonephila clavipes]|nr:hypothetical protein TNCV_4591481 [Trichonephila clavipes]
MFQTNDLELVGKKQSEKKKRSLDIIGYWNAKRSSVPYLVYWALDVDCLRWRSCILIGGHGRRKWEGADVSPFITPKFLRKIREP